ncbi:amidase [Nesterenkonia populi]|uniref:amidase n=1 Tax=Nesterenkonia populi TaxID=1591087 RepID=UPI0011BD8669|nr:amidase [Nesterenkonia populi]
MSATPETTAALTHRSACELAADVRSGTLGAVEVTQAHLDRIAEVNPAVNAVQDLQAHTALEQARAIDAQPDQARSNLPLAGLPVAVKDLAPTAGFRYTQGSPIFADRVAGADALFVSRMRAAGAVMIGKTNTPEFGLGSHTFNSVYGATRNPYDLARTAGGSSGGAAAAVATRMLPIADGSDTGGSLRNPASFCNVVGLRPSLGKVPNVPADFPYSTLSVKGPMARTVRDTALLMSTMIGNDLRDPFSVDEDPTRYLDVAGSPPGDRIGKQRLRVAWTPDFSGSFPVETSVLEVLEPVISQLAETETEMRVESAHPDLSGAHEAFCALRGLQVLATLGPLALMHPEKLKEDARWNVEVGRRVTGVQASKAHRVQGINFQRMAQFLTDYDVLLTPTCQVPPFEVGQRYPRQIGSSAMADYLEWMALPSAISLTSHPAISVPVGFTAEGHPVGLQIVGRYRSEAALLEYAKRIEAICGSSVEAPQTDFSVPQERFPEIL